MREAKRIFRPKFILLILSVMILNIGVYIYGQMSGRTLSQFRYDQEQYNMLIEKYQQTDLESAESEGTEAYALILDYNRILRNDSDTDDSDVIDTDTAIKQLDEKDSELLTYYENLTEQQQKRFLAQFRMINTKLAYLSGYHDEVETVLSNAIQMQKFSLFSKKDSFSYNNIIQTSNDFQRVENVQLILDNDRGTDTFVHCYNHYYFAAALMVFMIYGMMKERENGMWQIIHISAEGRVRLAVNRILIIAGGSFFILGLLYVSTFITSMILYGGWKSLTHPVQTIADFSKFTFDMSKGTYLVVLFGIACFTLCALSVILWMLFVIFRNRNHTLLCVAIFMAVQILLYQKIEIQSNLNELHYINIVNLLRISVLYRTYLNWGFGTCVFSVMSILYLALFIFCMVAVLCGVFQYVDMRPVSKTNVLHRFWTYVYEQYQKVFTRETIVIKELHKLVISGKGIWIILATIIVSVYFSVTGTMTFTDAQKEHDQMYLEHGGSNSVYICDYVQEKMDAYTKLEEQFLQVKEQYEAGEVGLENYVDAMNAVQYQGSVIKNLSEYREKLTYQQEIKEAYGQTCWLISDRGYEEIFGQYGDQRELILLFTMVIAIMFIISECMAMEYRTGMYTIVQSYSRGRWWIRSRRIAACLLYSIGMTVLIYGIEFANLNRIYSMPYLNAPAISLTFLRGVADSVAVKVSILQWIEIRMLARIVLAIITMVIALTVSRLIGKKGNRAVMPIVLVVMLLLIWGAHNLMWFL